MDQGGLLFQRYDLHTHTTASDGVLTPVQLVQRACKQGVNILAITDHDTTAALSEANQAITQYQLPLQLISGVEISTLWEKIEIHIVGLNFDPDHPAMVNLLAEQQQKRVDRAIAIAEKLEKAGIENALLGTQQIAGRDMLTRAHFARYLIQCGKARSVAEVFKRYLAKGKIGYVPAQWCDIRTAVHAIHLAGGKAVLAHPGRYQLSTKWLKRLLQFFAEQQGDAIEIAQCQQPPMERKQLADYAIHYDLSVSMGSDFHQPCPWIELGRNLWLPKEVKPIWHQFARADQGHENIEIKEV